MAEVLVKTGIKRESGWLYFVDKAGNAARVKMARKGEKTSKKQEVLAKAGIKREKGFLYFIDKAGRQRRTRQDGTWWQRKEEDRKASSKENCSKEEEVSLTLNSSSLSFSYFSFLSFYVSR